MAVAGAGSNQGPGRISNFPRAQCCSLGYLALVPPATCMSFQDNRTSESNTWNVGQATESFTELVTWSKDTLTELCVKNNSENQQKGFRASAFLFEERATRGTLLFGIPVWTLLNRDKHSWAVLKTVVWSWNSNHIYCIYIKIKMFSCYSSCLVLGKIRWKGQEEMGAVRGMWRFWRHCCAQALALL